jgi:hypothetical protein
MHDLITLQDQVTAAILGGDMAHIADEFLAGEADAAMRLSIFRNNTFISLTEALKAIFPVTVKLSDPRFFAYAAHEFIARHPPSEARLSQFGGLFPKFLAAFEACKDFPIIAEMAALEWCIAQSFNEAEETPISASILTTETIGDGAVGLRLQPSLRFAISRWPLLGVWSSHQKEEVIITAPLSPRISRVAISTRDDDIQLIELDAARFTFWRALARGQRLELAAIRALNRDRLFDLVRETMLLFRSGLVTGVFTHLQREPTP